MNTCQPWHFWIDRGGTFTDVVAVSPSGGRLALKVLSSDRASIDGMRAALNASHNGSVRGEESPIPECVVKMGTTVATNALLERKGERTALVITKGLEDVLAIGYQNRPDIFDLNIRKPRPLAETAVEIDERVTADGNVLVSPDDETIGAELRKLYADGVRSIAIVFMHSYAFPEHERRVAEMARRMGFERVSVSSELIPSIKIVGRGDTTVVDAYVTPVLQRHVRSLLEALPAGVRLQLMQSSGGLADAQRFSGKDAVMSGPAGGVVACAQIARRGGWPRVIGFDMGGTSTDVSRFDGQYERVYETEIAGVRLKAPMISIETVAAGGGSILRFDGRKFRVGPESAGADPGPACYGNGGPLTVTDANLLLGRIHPAFFPFPLDQAVVQDGFETLRSRIRESSNSDMSLADIAEGFRRIANENMANAIKKISVARGYDARDYALVAFGGAAGQHACAIARLLGIKTILVPREAGVLSAVGMGLAEVTRSYRESVLRPLSADALGSIGPRFAALEARGRREIEAEGISANRVRTRRSLALRYEGVEHSLAVSEPSDSDYAAAFRSLHERRFGFLHENRDLEIAELLVDVIGEADVPEAPAESVVEQEAPEPDAAGILYSEGRSHAETPVYRRQGLSPGHRLPGPAVVVDDTATVVIDPGFAARVDEHGSLVIERVDAASVTTAADTERDPVLLEVFGNLFMSIADQMGATLQKIALSTNVKERLDFSCAVFDADGDLVANAHHIPVHLGAMSETVRGILEDNRDDMRTGDVFVTNNPYRGGSHLPDITVITPVYDAEGRRLFFTASRAHHADVGGVAPGSMPPFSHSINEEGVVIDNFKLVSAGVFRENEMRALLSRGPYPVRDVDERIADLQAQIAANALGARLLLEAVGMHTWPVVAAYMDYIQQDAEESVRELLRGFPDGDHAFRDRLDDGTPICVSVSVQGDEAVIDFDGTGPQVAGNLNAPHGVVMAAVLYVFRALLRKDIPLNAGCLRPIRVRIPPDTVLSPSFPAAVAGGNVETSQRICDVLFGALGAVAASQGTMNNVSFGDDTFAYYETIAGGAGAGPDFDGADAVHTHMTNTRITDPEVLETRCPVLVREFSVRRGSGGHGKRRGGDGVIRRIEFREPLDVSILSERRAFAPYGLNGGKPGAKGRNTLTTSAGEERDLDGKTSFTAQPGDVLSIHTPGGGGWGR